MDEELSEADDPGLRVLLLCNLVYRRAGDAGRLGPGAADRERLGRKRTPGLSSLAVPGRDRGADPAAVLLHLLEEPAPGEHWYGAGGGPAHGAGECAEAGVPGVLRQEQPGGHPDRPYHGVEHAGTSEHEDGGRGDQRLYPGGGDPAVRGYLLPACGSGGAPGCSDVRLCPAGHRPAERLHRTGGTPGPGGSFRRDHRIHLRPAGSEIFRPGRSIRPAIPEGLPGQQGHPHQE